MLEALVPATYRARLQSNRLRIEWDYLAIPLFFFGLRSLGRRLYGLNELLKFLFILNFTG